MNMVDSPKAWRRLCLSLAIGSIGCVGFWSYVVALPAVQAGFGATRAEASLPYTLSMLGFAAGGIFMGEHSFEVLGDYIAGPSHVMPTGGSARFASPLNVLDFVHIISLIALNPATTAEIAPHAAVIARAEGLEAHARSADFRTKP